MCRTANRNTQNYLPCKMVENLKSTKFIESPLAFLAYKSLLKRVYSKIEEFAPLCSQGELVGVHIVSS